jgi:hypothetical protein
MGGNSIIRYYAKQIYPEQLDDIVWCETVMDIWLYRYLESKEVKK